MVVVPLVLLVFILVRIIWFEKLKMYLEMKFVDLMKVNCNISINLLRDYYSIVFIEIIFLAEKFLDDENFIFIAFFVYFLY